MRRTSWRDCGERSIGPDGYRLTSAAHHLRSRRARPLSSSGTAATLANEWRGSWSLTSPIPAPRAPKDEKVVASSVLMDRAPHRYGLSDRPQSQQRPDQFSALAKVLPLPSLQALVREFRFNVFEHLW
jgi:hypothetical protein